MDWNKEFNIDIKQVAKEVRQIREEKKVIYDDYGQAVPSGKKQSEEIEVMVISPGSNLWKIWIKPRDVLKE
jgi:hypothetical protein